MTIKELNVGTFYYKVDLDRELFTLFSGSNSVDFSVYSKNKSMLVGLMET